MPSVLTVTPSPPHSDTANSSGSAGGIWEEEDSSKPKAPNRAPGLYIRSCGLLFVPWGYNRKLKIVKPK